MDKGKREFAFLSYAHNDLEKVLKIYKGLKKRNVQVWFDKVDLEPGKWYPQIMRKITQSRYFIFCVSKAALKKTVDGKPGFVDEELQRAYEIAMNQPDKVFTIIPVRIENCGRGDTRTSSYQQYDLFENFEKELDKLAVHLGGISLSGGKVKDERTEDDKLIESLFGKADMAVYSGEHDKAVAMYETVINIDPKNHVAWFKKGLVFITSGKYKEAISVFDKTLEIKPGNLEALNNKRIALNELKKKSKKKRRELIEDRSNSYKSRKLRILLFLTPIIVGVIGFKFFCLKDNISEPLVKPGEKVDVIGKRITRNDKEGASLYIKKTPKKKTVDMNKKKINSILENIKNKKYYNASIMIKQSKNQLGLYKTKKIKEKLLDSIVIDLNNIKEILKSEISKLNKIGYCKKFLSSIAGISNNEKILTIYEQIEKKVSQLQYDLFIQNANEYLLSKKFSEAVKEVNKALYIDRTKKGEDLLKRIEREKSEHEIQEEKWYCNNVKKDISFSSFSEFVNKFPNSNCIPELSDLLKKKDKKLPPKKYLTRIEINKKGFYEIDFGMELNRHTMIYLHEKKIWIDKFEVSVDQFIRAINKDLMYIKNKWAIVYNHPISPVSYKEAEEYCMKFKKLGLRLPTESEWEYAAGEKYIFPWGNKSPVSFLSPPANYNLNKGETVPVDSFSEEKYISFVGCVNMAGNVWEWVSEKKLKGGAALSTEDSLKVKESSKNQDNFVGFRCVKEEKNDDYKKE